MSPSASSGSGTSSPHRSSPSLMLPATVYVRRRFGVGGAGEHDRHERAVDEGFGRDVEPGVEARERDAVAFVERDDLGEQNARLLDEVVTGLARDRHAERAEVLGEHVRVGVDVQRFVLGPLRDAEAAARR